MTSPVIAYGVPQYAIRAPYITVEEYVQSPTGVDVSQLVPQDSTVDNATALGVAIRRASSWADNLCNQVLAATLDVQAGLYRIRSDGTIQVPLDNTPIVAVVSCSTGSSPSSLAALTDLSNAWIGPKTVTVPAAGCGQVYATVTYVNGWANTTLVGPQALGANSVTVANGTGIVPGLQLTIYDGNSTETVTVAAGYTFGATTVPLAAPLANAHDDATAISAFPASIKQAVVSLTSALIKTRGADAITMASLGAEPSVQALTEAGGMTDLEVAVDLLSTFRRVI